MKKRDLSIIEVVNIFHTDHVGRKGSTEGFFTNHKLINQIKSEMTGIDSVKLYGILLDDDECLLLAQREPVTLNTSSWLKKQQALAKLTPEERELLGL